jgi:hypothetical protein
VSHQLLEDRSVHRGVGKKGTGEGEFDVPHAIAVDSHERVYVADRSNSRRSGL